MQDRGCCSCLFCCSSSHEEEAAVRADSLLPDATSREAHPSFGRRYGRHSYLFPQDRRNRMHVCDAVVDGGSGCRPRVLRSLWRRPLCLSSVECMIAINQRTGSDTIPPATDVFPLTGSSLRYTNSLMLGRFCLSSSAMPSTTSTPNRL